MEHGFNILNNNYPIKTYPINLEYDIEKSISIIIYMIDKCNYTCEYCINKMPRTNTSINIELLYLFLLMLYAYTKKILLIELAGGEPLLHNKLFDFLVLLKNSNILYELSITTNFSYSIDIYKLIINIIPCKFVFSYHIINGDLNAHLLSFINKLYKIDSSYYSNCCIRILYNNKYDKYCLDVVNKMINAFDKLIRIEFCLLLSTLIYTVIYSKTQLNAYYNMLHKLLPTNIEDEYVIEYNDHSTKQYNIYDMCVSQRQILSNYLFWKCYAGYSNYYIHCNGYVYPCANYYDLNKKPLCNINNKIFNFRKINMSTICLLKLCRCEFPLIKEKILKYET